MGSAGWAIHFVPRNRAAPTPQSVLDGRRREARGGCGNTYENRFWIDLLLGLIEFVALRKFSLCHSEPSLACLHACLLACLPARHNSLDQTDLDVHV